MSTSLPDMTTLAPAVAAQLGSDWTTQPDPEGASERAFFLHHHDGRRVRLSVNPWETGRDQGRLHASGRLPDKPDDVDVDTMGIDGGNITMAGTKTAWQVAAEIRRRLLPTLTQAHAEWIAKVHRLRAEEAQRTAVAEQLARVPGMSPQVRSRYGIPTDRRKWHLSWDGTPRGEKGHTGRHTTTPSARVEVDAKESGEYVRVELSGLSGDQAERVLRALLEPEQPDPSDMSLSELCDRIEAAAQQGYTLSQEDQGAIWCARNPYTDNGADDLFIATTGTTSLPEYILALAQRTGAVPNSRASKQP